MMDSANNCAYCGFSLNSKAESKYPQALPYGSILHGKYITGRVLGQGGFGITYVAQDYNTKELVAIKEYFPGAMATRTGTRSVQAYNVANSDSFSFGKRIFLKEATTLSRFSGNPNIVKVRSFFEENGTAYFAMEYVKGESLKSYVRKRGGGISWQEAERILLPVMEALEAVHAQGIIHRDISPDNIALADNGQVKLLDFGAARYSMGERSQSLSVVLKHGYAPAEQYSRHGHQGPWTDVYAMAATFYNVLTGEMVPDSIDRTHSDTLVLPSRLGVIVPEHVEAALAKALSVRQEDRFQSMADFRDALTGKVILPKTVFSDPIATEVPPAGSTGPSVQPDPVGGTPQHSGTTIPGSGGDGPGHTPPAGPKGPSGKRIGLAAAAVILLICGILFIKSLFPPDTGAGNTEEGITSGNFLNQGFFAMSEKDCYAYSGSKLYYCKDSDLSAAELVGDGRAGEFLNVVDSHLYFLSQYEHAIYRMDPDGSNKVKVYDASSDTANEPANLYIYHGWFYFSNHNKLFRGSLKDLDDLEKGPLTKAECIVTDFNYENKVLASLCFIEDRIYYDGEKGLSSMGLDGAGKKAVCDMEGKFITDGQAIYCLNGLYRVSRILPDGSVAQIIDLKDVGKIREINYADGWIYYLLEVDDGKYLCRAGTDGSGNVAIDFVTEGKNTVVSMNTFADSEYAFFYILEKDGENLTPVSKSIDIPKETSSSAAPQTGAGSKAEGKAEEGNASSDTNTPSEENKNNGTMTDSASYKRGEETIIDNEVFKAVVTGYEPDYKDEIGISHFVVNMLLENKADTEEKVYIDYTSVNRFGFDSSCRALFSAETEGRKYFDFVIPEGEKKKVQLDFRRPILTAAGISSIDEIKGAFSLYYDNYRGYEYMEFALYPTGKTAEEIVAASPISENDVEILFDNSDVAFGILKRSENTERLYSEILRGGKGFVCFAANKTDHPVDFWLNKASINGITHYSYYGDEDTEKHYLSGDGGSSWTAIAVCGSGTELVNWITFDERFLEENKIGEVSDIANFTFEVLYGKPGSPDTSTGPVTYIPN